MKTNSIGTKILMAVVCLVVVAYFGLQACRYFHDPLTTTVAYTYQVEKTTSATGWVVRDEQVLTGESNGGLLRLSRAEGERVSKGGAVAVIYSDESAVKTEDQIDEMETKIAQLQYAQAAAVSNEVSLKLDSQITDSILSLRGDLSADRMESADEHISDLRALVLKRDYTYADNEDLSAQIESLQTQLKGLRSTAASGSRTITAPEAGIYSAVVDGYETVLTPDSLKDLTPSSLESIQADSSVSTDLGKLILGDTWYYAATMTESDAKDLEEGKSLLLRFAKGTDRELSVKITSISKAENGRVAVVFSGRQYLPELTLLRQQSADVIHGSTTGIRVPENAIRVDENGISGIYCVVGMTARFKPVTVLYTGDGFALVQAASTTSGTNCLRNGDEVIITANDLFDGKVIS